MAVVFMSDPCSSVGSTPLLCDSSLRFRFLTKAAFSSTDSRMLDDFRVMPRLYDYMYMCTRWPFSLFTRLCWHQNKGCVLLLEPYTITQPLFWCQHNLVNKLNGHPVFRMGVTIYPKTWISVLSFKSAFKNLSRNACLVWISRWVGSRWWVGLAAAETCILRTIRITHIISVYYWLVKAFKAAKFSNYCGTFDRVPTDDDVTNCVFPR